MTKPRAKSREELSAEIGQAGKLLRQCGNREGLLGRKPAIEEPRERSRLCLWDRSMKSLVRPLIPMAGGEAKPSPRPALSSEPARVFLKKRAGKPPGESSLWNKGPAHTP